MPIQFVIILNLLYLSLKNVVAKKVPLFDHEKAEKRIIEKDKLEYHKFAKVYYDL